MPRPDLGIPQRGEGESITLDQVNEIVKTAVSSAVAENDSKWQGIMTREQQRRSNLDREVSALRGRLDQLGETPSIPAAPDPRPSNEIPEEWEDISDGKSLFRAVDSHFDRKLAASRRDPELERELHETRATVDDMQLERDLADMRSQWPWMRPEHVDAVLQMCIDTGNGDVEYIAERMFGPPGEYPRDGRHVDSDDNPQPAPRQRPTPLTGSDSGATGSPPRRKVKIRRGQAGWSDVVRHGIDWARDTGRM